MLYQQLQRVQELDKQINDLHIKLADIYKERATLTTQDAVATPKGHTQPSADDISNQLAATWRAHGITTPKTKQFSKKLQHAASIVESLTADNPQLIDNIQVVAVPPQKQLDTLLTHPNPLASRYVFTEDYHQNISLKSSAWNIVVITSPEFALAIDQLDETLGKDTLRYKNHDCRALGVRETIAADISGVNVVTENNWTLLLKDAKNHDFIPCVTSHNNQLVFEIEDARGLLGNNYVQPAVTA